MFSRAIKLSLISIILSLGLLSPIFDLQRENPSAPLLKEGSSISSSMQISVGSVGSSLQLCSVGSSLQLEPVGSIVSPISSSLQLESYVWNKENNVITSLFWANVAYGVDLPRGAQIKQDTEIARAAKAEADKKSEDEKTKNFTPDYSQSLLKFSQFLAVILKPLMYLNWLFIAIAWAFMDNRFIYDPVVIDDLHNVWLMFRNIVNILFVFLLIVVALKNLFMWKKLEDLWKIVWKIVIALVLVNFSWFAIKVVVDFGSVMTNVVFRLPFDLIDKTSPTFQNWRMIEYIQINFKPDLWIMAGNTSVTEDSTADNENSVARTVQSENNEVSKFHNVFCAIEVDKISDGDFKKVKDDLKKCSSKGLKSEIYNCNTNALKPVDDKCIMSYGKGGDDEKWPSNAMIVLFTNSLGSVVDDSRLLSTSSIAGSIALNFIPIENLNKISGLTNSFSTVTFSLIFSIIISIATVIIFLSFSIVMIERVVALWIIIMLSPFGALLYVSEQAWFKSEKMTLDKMISALLTYAILIPVWVWAVFAFVFIIINQFFQLRPSDSWDRSTNMADQLWWAWDLILAIVVLWILWTFSFYFLEKAQWIWKDIVSRIKWWVQSFVKETWKNLQYIPLIPMGKDAWSENSLKLSLGNIFDKSKWWLFWEFAAKAKNSPNPIDIKNSMNAASRVDIEIKEQAQWVINEAAASWNYTWNFENFKKALEDQWGDAAKLTTQQVLGEYHEAVTKHFEGWGQPWDKRISDTQRDTLYRDYWSLRNSGDTYNNVTISNKATLERIGQNNRFIDFRLADNDFNDISWKLTESRVKGYFEKASTVNPTLSSIQLYAWLVKLASNSSVSAQEAVGVATTTPTTP